MFCGSPPPSAHQRSQVSGCTGTGGKQGLWLFTLPLGWVQRAEITQETVLEDSSFTEVKDYFIQLEVGGFGNTKSQGNTPNLHMWTSLRVGKQATNSNPDLWRKCSRGGWRTTGHMISEDSVLWWKNSILNNSNMTWPLFLRSWLGSGLIWVGNSYTPDLLWELPTFYCPSSGLGIHNVPIFFLLFFLNILQYTYQWFVHACFISFLD